ncbi:MAG: hypothetical protein NZ932_03025, partial [Candidatus Bathyarchaeota archaeon]|nr:hypothetical protein [Candidatus Bathyarchaeota archaeon]
FSVLFATVANADVGVIYDSDLNQPDVYWLAIGWTLGKGNWTKKFNNGVACLYVNDMQCTNWTGVKIQQGSMPHKATLNWSQSHPLRINPIVNSATNFKIRVRLRLSNVAFNLTAPSRPKNESWVNVGISLWMQRPGTDWSGADPQLEVGLKLFWLLNGKPYKDSIYFQGDLGRDYHSLFDVYNETTSDIGRWVEIEFTTNPYTSQALSYWGVEYAILRNVDIYIETIGGAGYLEVDHISMESYKEDSSSWTIVVVVILIVLILMFALIMIRRRQKRWR